MWNFQSTFKFYRSGNTIDTHDIGSAHSTELSAWENSFLQETDRIEQIDQSIRRDIERKYRKSETNAYYQFLRQPDPLQQTYTDTSIPKQTVKTVYRRDISSKTLKTQNKLLPNLSQKQRGRTQTFLEYVTNNQDAFKPSKLWKKQTLKQVNPKAKVTGKSLIVSQPQNPVLSSWQNPVLQNSASTKVIKHINPHYQTNIYLKDYSRHYHSHSNSQSNSKSNSITAAKRDVQSRSLSRKRINPSKLKISGSSKNLPRKKPSYMSPSYSQSTKNLNSTKFKFNN